MSEGLIKLLVLVLILCGIFYMGDSNGALRIQAKWDKSEKDINAQLEAVRLEKQGEADKMALEAKKILNKLTRENLDLQKRLQNEINSNGVYRACVVPDNGVQLYNQVAGSLSRPTAN